ncbi:phosphoribosyltransferase family protein [Arthrobacter agilis]|uniref:ComF family protein n=1 Tax=Arthrobacter agilis TaxID=37921 RepID=UPI002366D2F1|nr:phosphoribosyltransferase family protein [Arthrobacter agilis]WDF32423.1 phosphoribosyltransferase family protein [Arthrobacter agilis]
MPTAPSSTRSASSIAGRLDRLFFGRTARMLRGAANAFAFLLLPSSCLLCGAWNTSLCRSCATTFRRATSCPFRAEDGAEALPDVDRAAGTSRSPADHDADYGPLPVIAAGRYGAAVSRVLLAYKNHGRVDVAAPIAAALAGALHMACTELGPSGTRASPVLLVPVPTRSSSRRRRGYDPLMVLLTRLDRMQSLPAGTVLAPVVRQVSAVHRIRAMLARSGATRPTGLRAWRSISGGNAGQKGLGRRSRRTNVLLSMAPTTGAHRRLTGAQCIIVDDVLTTGATIGEVHRVLRGEAATVLGAAVIAATAGPASAPVPAAPGTRAAG